MPLHLLSKKSWNVYAPKNIERVRADEAAAAVREEEHDQRLRDYEAEKRLALLRGERAPSFPPDPSALKEQPRKRERRDDGKDDRRKRRKLVGEDDTERDIRVAWEEEEAKQRRGERAQQNDVEKARQREEAVPLTDYKGHIQLFAPPSTKRICADKNEEAEREKKEAKEKDGADGEGMRFRDAAGYGRKSGAQPWYANGMGYTGTEEVPASTGDGVEEVRKNAFGRDDPGRGRRDMARVSAADPMTAMAKAQTHLKSAERRRKDALREREAELEELKMEQERDEGRRKRRHREEDELEGFSLDAPYHSNGRGQHSRNHRRRSRSRSRDKDHHYRRHRSRSERYATSA